MKRAGGLFDPIFERENLREATYRALRGKRSQPDARAFMETLDENLDRLAAEGRHGDLQLGVSHEFWIHDPKLRLITAPCFRERVLHHAIMRVCEPVFERWLIDDTFACRVGLGRDRALFRAGEFARRFPLFAQMDIRGFFRSVPRDELFRRLNRLFKDERLLRLFAQILGSDADGLLMGRGLPIGSLTSQHFANFYLGWLDRFVKEQCRIRGFVRYMDDFVIWGSDRDELKAQQRHCASFLADELSLELKRKPAIRETAGGMSFLGCRVFPTHVELNRRSRRRFRSRLRDLERLHQTGQISDHDLQTRATALVAFTRSGTAQSWQFRCNAINDAPVNGHEPRTA